MKTTKIITVMLFSAFLLSILSFSAFAKIEENDLDENLQFYYRISKAFTEDFVSFVCSEAETYTNEVAALEDCGNFLSQAAYYLQKELENRQFEYYELDFSFNDIKLDEGGGNIHATATIKFVDFSGNPSYESLDFFIRIGTPQKVIKITDAIIMGDAKFEKTVYVGKFEDMTLDKFISLSDEDKNYSDFAEKLQPYMGSMSVIIPNEELPQPSDDNSFIGNPQTTDISMIFYILAAISAVFACSSFRKTV